MEQNGTPGKVNVSESAYFRVNKQFNCEERGEILTTKKGPLKMFYVNKQ